MLEVLKQLQVKPRFFSMQANICNQKMPGDCTFLGSFTHRRHVGDLSYRQISKGRAHPVFAAWLNAPAFSPKTLQSLEVSGLYWRNIQPSGVLPGNLVSLGSWVKKPPQPQKPPL
jgi:hypothetical protein